MKQVARLWLLAAALLAITLLGAAIASAQGRTAGTSAATTLASAPAAEESGENPAGEGGEGEKTYELPNFMEWIYELNREPINAWLVGVNANLPPLLQIDWKNITNLTFCFIVVILLCTFVIIGTSKRALRPKSRFYLFLELIAMALYDFFYQVLGKDTRKYISLIGTLFIYILCLNLFGLIPLMKSPTSVWGINAAMALAVFFYVQYTGFVRSGFVGYFKHLLGEPLWLAPLMFPLHLVGELIKPVSLSLRLFGNILGEDTLLAVFAGLLSLGFINFPLHLPFMFMAVLFSTIQALIFSMLTAVYISLMLPHEEHGH
jgi:F-type H+-transporting ATPase subunit a